MSKINIQVMTDDAYEHLKKNIKVITKKIKDNEDNSWVKDEFKTQMYIKKTFEIEDFNLKENANCEDKDVDLENSIKIYESLKVLPRYVLTNEKFWLWLYFDKFYKVVRGMMPVQSDSTIKDHWMFSSGARRGIFFGVLSRCYFRVALTVDESLEDKYELTKWVIENPLRFREMTWRTYSSEEHIVRGAIKAEKRRYEELGAEDTTIYPSIAKHISKIGSAKLLDAMSEEEIEQEVTNFIASL